MFQPTEKLQAIVLPTYPDITEELSVEALSQMRRLKLLRFGKINFSGCLDFLSNELGYLQWKEYPFTSLPSSFQPNKLVILILDRSNIKELWKGTKDLHNLTHLELCHCKNLEKMPNLSQAPNLSWLNLKGCVKLVHLDPSIGCLKKLGYLSLKNCKNLVSIPNSILHLNSLYHLNLSGCWKLFKHELLEKPRQSEQLNTGQSVESHMTSSICKTLTRPLHFLSSRRRPNSVGLLVSSLSNFPALTFLNLSFCNLVQIPEPIGQLQCLESLNIGGNNIVTLPHCIKELPKLRKLNLQHCKHLRWLPSTLLPITRGSRGRFFWGGIYVFNCRNLSDTEGCSLTVMSWMIKMIQVNMQSSLPRCGIQVVVPGNKIPRWFNKQNTGNSVSLDPSPILDNNNWIGIATCVTFAAHHALPQLLEELKDRRIGILCGFRSEHRWECTYHVPIRLNQDLITPELDHILLIFFYREVFIDTCTRFGSYDLHGIELLASTSYREAAAEIKSCGYCWVFKEDLEQLNPTMMYTANSAHNQKHKFLTIQDGK